MRNEVLIKYILELVGNRKKLQWLSQFSTNFGRHQLCRRMRNEEVVSPPDKWIIRNKNSMAQISQCYDGSPLQSFKQLDRCIIWMVLARGRAVPESACVNSGVLLFGVSCPFVRSTRSKQNKRNTFYYHYEHHYQLTIIKHKANTSTSQG
jgi:hypothetical protein